MPDTHGTEASGSSRKHVLSAFVFQAVALIVAGWTHRHALNPNGVAYLRIASYYADGNMDLAISGYWSPLISWLLAPWLKLGVPPLIAARIVMGLSAVFFLSGCLRIFRAFGLSNSWLDWGVWTCAVVSVPWSVENITPDLLAAGLVGFAFAPMVEERWMGKAFVSFASGLGWGMAYLGEALALPLAILTAIGLAILWQRKRPAAMSSILRNVGLTLLGIALIAGPWIRVISAKYGTFTVSDSARLNHVFVGPTVAQPVYVLDQGFHRPEPGRITIWEEPPMPYPDWSPFSSWSNAWLQARVIARNVPIVFVMLTSVNLAVPLLAIYSLWQLRRVKGGFGDPSNLGWAAVPIAVLSVLFLPNYVLITEQRYFYPVLPLFFVLGALVLCGQGSSWPAWIRRFGPALVALMLVLPTFARVCLRPGSSRVAGECAYELAQKIQSAGLAGPVAGSGKLPGGRSGLYVAYLLDQPWYGDEPLAGALSYRRSGARLVVVNRGSRVARELSQDVWYHDLDSRLFDSATKAGEFPLQVFESIAGGME